MKCGDSGLRRCGGEKGVVGVLRGEVWKKPGEVCTGRGDVRTCLGEVRPTTIGEVGTLNADGR